MKPRSRWVTAVLCALLWPGWLRAAESDRSVEEGKAVFQRVITAMGGIQAISELRTMRYQVQVLFSTPQGERSLSGEITMKYPDKLEFVTNSDQGRVRRIINGSKGTVKVADRVQPLPEDAVRELQAVFYRDFFYIAQNAGRYQIRSLGRITLEGKDLVNLQFAGPGETFRCLIDSR